MGQVSMPANAPQATQAWTNAWDWMSGSATCEHAAGGSHRIPQLPAKATRPFHWSPSPWLRPPTPTPTPTTITTITATKTTRRRHAAPWPTNDSDGDHQSDDEGDDDDDDEPMGEFGGWLGIREDFMTIGRGLDTRLGPEKEDADDDGVTDRFDERYDVFYSRWIFLGRYFDDWFTTADFENQDTSSYMAVRFDCFNVSLPATIEQSPASDAYLRRLRDATELVAGMVRVDVAAWQFMKKAAKPAFRHYHVASYDPEELEPKMKRPPRSRLDSSLSGALWTFG